MGSFPIKKHFACESNDFMDRILRLKRVVILTTLFSFPIKEPPRRATLKSEIGMRSDAAEHMTVCAHRVVPH